MSLMEELEKISESTFNSVEGIELDLRWNVVKFIFDRLDESGMTQRELAEKLNMGESQLTRILALDANLTLKTIARVFKTFGEKPALVAQSAAHLAEAKAISKPIGVAAMPYRPNAFPSDFTRSFPAYNGAVANG